MADQNIGRLYAVLGLRKEEFDRVLAQAEGSLRQASRRLQDVGRSLTTTVTLPLVGAATAAVKASSDFENAMARVANAIDAPESSIDGLADAVTALSEEIPVAATELAGIVELAGQMGIAFEAIPAFTRTVAELGAATDLAFEEGARTLSQFQKVMGTADEDLERLASTIVALGDGFGASESELSALALRLARVGAALDLSESQALGLAAALRGLGLESRAGVTGITSTLLEMQEAVASGRAELAGFAQVAGLSAGEFRRAFGEDALGAFEQFVEGLAALRGAGGDVLTVLRNLGLEEKAQRDVLLVLTGNTELLARALQTADRAWLENVAAAQEARRMWSTLQSQLTTLWNGVVNLSRGLGDALRPALDAAISGARSLREVAGQLAKQFEEADRSTRLAAGAMLAIAAATGPVLFFLGQLAFSVTSLLGLLSLLAAHPVAIALGVLGAAALALSIDFSKVDSAADLVVEAVRAVSGAVRSTVDFVRDLGTVLGNLAGAASRAAAAVREAGLAILEALPGGPLEDTANAIGELITRYNELAARFAAADPSARPGELLANLRKDIRETAATVRQNEALLDPLFAAKQGTRIPVRSRVAPGAARRAAAPSPDLDETLTSAVTTAEQVTDAFEALDRELRVVTGQTALLGPEFDAAAARAGVLEGAIVELLRAGLDPTSAKLESLATELATLRFDAQAFAEMEAAAHETAAGLGELDAIFDELDFEISSAGMDEFERRAAELERQIRAVGTAADLTAADIDELVAQGAARLGELEEASRGVSLELGREIAGALGTITDAWIRGTREQLDVLEVFRDTALSIVSSLFRDMIEAKLEGFDVPFEQNLLEDAVGIVRQFAGVVVDLFRDAAGSAAAALEVEGTTRSAQEVATETISTLPELQEGPAGSDVPEGILRSLDRAVAGAGELLGRLSAEVQLAVAAVRDSALSGLAGLRSFAAGGLGFVESFVRQGLALLAQLIASAATSAASSAATYIGPVLSAAGSYVGGALALAEGGLVRGPGLAYFEGPAELVAPLARLGAAGGGGLSGLQVIIDNKVPGTRASAQHESAPDGRAILRVLLSQALHPDLTEGGPTQRLLASDYNVHRQPTIR